ncbi:coat protein [Eggplant mosaic virus]|uniref:Capsid protein n=1 Tax=Eggplant mosaic virus TaxID=12151 RepID=CAPSD_EPMV|nr:coat protein [Eggplant mosaic virus]P20123.1 RecName: Full=Coat protein; AltName: Full=Virion protein [Eggplant mosaic virus]AAA43040.1 virion protein [Eggplant mosaic virus]
MEDTAIIRSPQPSINAPGFHLPPTDSQQSSAIELPFQFQATTFGATETAAQISLASANAITKLASLYRHVRLTQCAATITPTAAAIANPLTVNIVWVSDNSTAKPTEILNVFGGSSYTFGGALNATKPLTIPLPMNSVNCMLKDSVLYTDCPKLLAYSAAPSSPSKTPTATIQIHGKLRLSSPLLQAN